MINYWLVALSNLAKKQIETALCIDIMKTNAIMEAEIP